MDKIIEEWICPHCKRIYNKGDTYVIRNGYANCDKCLEPLHILIKVVK